MRGPKTPDPNAPKPLLEVYEGRITFEVRTANDKAGKQASIDYGFGRLAHGLVGLDSEGKMGFSMPGHNYSRDDIAKNIDALLAGAK